MAERKYLDTYIESVDHDVPTLIENYDISESHGGFEYMTKSSAV